jgi:hypothetical protein
VTCDRIGLSHTTEQDMAVIHGHTRARNGKWSSIYIRFMNLKARCHRPRDPDYPRYGGKGITVCDRWRYGEGGKTGFECFLADMGQPPFEKASIDRIDGNKGYSPDNCRWASYKEQGNNRRTNRWVEIDGVRKTVQQWSDVSQIGPKTILYRLNRGIPPREAVFTPPDYARRWSRNP